MWDYAVQALDTMWRHVKPWLVPLTRTFLAAALPAFLIGINVQSLSSSAALIALAAGAVTAGTNAVILVLQRALPVVPNPAPPVA
jgi:hypothetical protein